MESRTPCLRSWESNRTRISICSAKTIRYVFEGISARKHFRGFMSRDRPWNFLMRCRSAQPLAEAPSAISPAALVPRSLRTNLASQVCPNNRVPAGPAPSLTIRRIGRAALPPGQIGIGRDEVRSREILETSLVMRRSSVRIRPQAPTSLVTSPFLFCRAILLAWDDRRGPSPSSSRTSRGRRSFGRTTPRPCARPSSGTTRWCRER